MTNARRLVRQTLTVARRDFIATVFTPIFLLFLFAPLIMGAFGAVGGLGASSVATSAGDRGRIVVIVPDAAGERVLDADKRLRTAFRERSEAPAKLITLRSEANPAAQAHAAFASKDYDAWAVMFGPADRPHILHHPSRKRAAAYLQLVAEHSLAAERLGGSLPRIEAIKIVSRRESASIGGRTQSAFLAVFGIFFLTLFLAGQVVGTMAEERANKVIEVLAAAVPLEAVFLGKLLGMFGVAVLFVAFWGTVVGQIGSLMPPQVAAGIAELSPAVGAPTFALLFCAYFCTAYLLLGSVFLGVGAQATTMREIQMLSLPITILQVAMFALSALAATRPGSAFAYAAELFPLSSPYAMAGRAANSPELWPHFAALAWQLLWVAIFIIVGARLFRRGVLQSGSARPFWRRRKAIDTHVS